MSRTVTVHELLPRTPPDLPQAHSSTHLPIPNPFKVLKTLSTDHIPDTATETPVERIELAEEFDHGEIGLPGPLVGLRAYDGGDGVRLCAWTVDEMLVRIPKCQ